MFWVLTRAAEIWFYGCMALVKIIKTSKISSKESSIVTKQEPVVKSDIPNFWSAFKSFVLVGGDLV